jgi:hypothetical protein
MENWTSTEKIAAKSWKTHREPPLDHFSYQRSDLPWVTRTELWGFQGASSNLRDENTCTHTEILRVYMLYICYIYMLYNIKLYMLYMCYKCYMCVVYVLYIYILLCLNIYICYVIYICYIMINNGWIMIKNEWQLLAQAWWRMAIFTIPWGAIPPNRHNIWCLNGTLPMVCLWHCFTPIS